MSVSVVCENAFSALGEAPHWDEATRSIHATDVLSHYLFTYNTVTAQSERKSVHGNKGETLTFMIPTTKKDFMISMGRRIQRFDWHTGQVTEVIAQVDEGTTNNINDAKCDATGRLWIGSMASIDYKNPHTIAREQGSMYSLERNGEIRKHNIMSNITASNGFAWTADNETMFFVETLPGTIYAFNFDLHGGNLSKSRVLVDSRVLPDVGEWLPDGMCMDMNDNLWIACYESGKVLKVDCNTGRITQSLKFPVQSVTSCCFGGVNRDELYVTSKGKALLSTQDCQNQSLAGSLFKVTGLGAIGVPVKGYDPV